MSRNFQGDSTRQGKTFAQVCKDALELSGFEIIADQFKVEDVGVNTDFHARNMMGIDFLFECKGSMRGKRPGSKRTDTVKKALINGFLISHSEIADFFPPMVLMTSHVATKGCARAMFRRVPTSILLAVLNPYNHGEFLDFLAEANEDEIKRWIANNPTVGGVIDRMWCNGEG